MVALIPGITPAVAELAARYARWSLLWIWPKNCFDAVHKYLQAVDVVLPQLTISATFVGVNLGLNIVLVGPRAALGEDLGGARGVPGED